MIEAAQALGLDARVGNAARKAKSKEAAGLDSSAQDLEMNKMLMSNKQRKLYERVRHSERKKNAEVCCTLPYQRLCS